LQGFLLQIAVSETVVHEADEPNAFVDFNNEPERFSPAPIHFLPRGRATLRTCRPPCGAYDVLAAIKSAGRSADEMKVKPAAHARAAIRAPIE